MKLNPTRFLEILNRVLRLDRRIIIIFLVALTFLIAGTASTNHTKNRTVNRTANVAANHNVGRTINHTVNHSSLLSQAATSTPIRQELTPALSLTPSPFPPELLENENQTIGLTIAATIIVLIVLAGVLNALLRASPGDR